MEACGVQNLKDKATKQVLLDLRKKISRLIADQQMDDPEAAADDALEADDAMGEMDDTFTEEPAVVEPEGEELAEEGNGLEEAMRAYMNPKAKERRPGTGVMFASMSKSKPMTKTGKYPRKGVA